MSAQRLGGKGAAMSQSIHEPLFAHFKRAGRDSLNLAETMNGLIRIGQLPRNRSDRLTRIENPPNWTNRSKRTEGMMGYQESLISVSSLAEVAGICRAIEKSEELKTLEYLVCCCATRAKRDLYYGDVFGMRKLSDIPKDESPIIRTGDLFAVVAGARLYQPFLWIDNIAGISELGYHELFDDIPLDAVRAEGALHPSDARRAEILMRKSLNFSYTLAMQGEHPIKLPDDLETNP